MVSLGCPKNLVDSERILTQLRADGYHMSPDYAGGGRGAGQYLRLSSTARRRKALEAIGEAIAENGRVIVTGCMGKEAETIRARFPQVLAVTGAHQYEQVVEAVHAAAPANLSPYIDLIPDAGLKLTPRHYSYLKISEGCNHRWRLLHHSRRCAATSSAAAPTRSCARRRSWSRRGRRNCWSSARTPRRTASTSVTCRAPGMVARYART